MRVVVLGANGMVGHALLNLPFKTFFLTRKEFDVLETPLWALPECDYIINCIGVVKQRIQTNDPNYHFVDKAYNASLINAAFPWKLASHCKWKSVRLVHVSTDCVFSGKVGYYKEYDTPDYDKGDPYSETKAWGEPDNAMVIRTSFVGPEKDNFLGLLEWTKRQSGAINGFANHTWNGITTKQFSKCITKIIQEDLYKEEIYHIFSPKPVTKYDMVKCFNQHFNLGLEIKPFEHEYSIKRTLSTEKDLNDKLNIPNFYKMVKQI